MVRSCNTNWFFFILGRRLRFPPPPPPPPASALTWTVILVLPAPPPAAAAAGERRDGCRGESWFVVVLALLLPGPTSTWQRRPSREQEKKRPGDGEVAQVTQSLHGWWKVKVLEKNSFNLSKIRGYSNSSSNRSCSDNGSGCRSSNNNSSSCNNSSSIAASTETITSRSYSNRSNRSNNSNRSRCNNGSRFRIHASVELETAESSSRIN